MSYGFIGKLTNKVVAFLKERQGTKLKNSDICKKFGLSPQTVRACVNNARFRNIPICSDQDGYFYSENPADVENTLNHMRSRIQKQQEAVSGLELFLRKQEESV